MSLPRLLVVSATAPRQPGVGSVVIEDLIHLYAADRVLWAVVGPSVRDGQQFGAVPFRCQAIKLWRPTPSLARGGAVNRLRRATAWHTARLAGVTRTIRVLQSVVTAWPPDLILAVLDEPILFPLVTNLARVARCPLTTLVWDPVDYLIKNSGCGRSVSAVLQADAFKAMSLSRQIGVISEAMAEEYGGRSHRPTIVLRHGLPRSLWIERRTRRCAQKGIMVALAGSLYASDAWNGLIRALDEAGWCIDGCRVTIRLLGGAVPRSPSGPCRYEVLGWHPQGTMIELLSEADVGYIPYPFDKDRATLARLSFPTKLGSYMAAGLPVLHHGPAFSSVTAFVGAYSVGRCCASLDTEAILDGIRTTLAAGSLPETRLGMRRALEEELGAHVFARRFARLLEIDAGDLRLESA